MSTESVLKDVGAVESMNDLYVWAPPGEVRTWIQRQSELLLDRLGNVYGADLPESLVEPAQRLRTRIGLEGDIPAEQATRISFW